VTGKFFMAAPCSSAAVSISLGVGPGLFETATGQAKTADIRKFKPVWNIWGVKRQGNH